MCCGGFQFPNAVGQMISDLQAGDQIVILMREGNPPVERDHVDIVWKVDGYSALTADGISINCHNISKLVRTGQHFEDFLVSEKAKTIWQQIQDDRPDYEVRPEPE